MKAGLVAGEGFAVDASVIEADASRPVRDYLTALDGEHSPTNPERKPKALSPTDPTAAWTTRGRHKVMLGYSLNYLIDMDHAVIVDVEATPTRITKEVDATETMIERTQDRFALKPRHVAGDVAYGTGEMLGWLVNRDINPHVPVWDQSEVAAEGAAVFTSSGLGMICGPAEWLIRLHATPGNMKPRMMRTRSWYAVVKP